MCYKEIKKIIHLIISVNKNTLNQNDGILKHVLKVTNEKEYIH